MSKERMARVFPHYGRADKGAVKCLSVPCIPWSIYVKAHAEYSKHWKQDIETLEDRGGFAESELDSLYPAWREEYKAWKEAKEVEK